MKTPAAWEDAGETDNAINLVVTLKGTGISQRRTVGETMATDLPLNPKTLEGQRRQRAHQSGRGGEKTVTPRRGDDNRPAETKLH